MARTNVNTDSNTLAALGKKEVLKRRFGFWSLFGFAVCELITWETVLALFSQGFDNGGPAGLVYGFIIAWSSTLSVYTVISELASMAPIAAGQYYWVYMLAPDRYKVFCSYIIGWLTSLAWIATVAIETIFAGTILQGLIILDHPDDYDPKEWHGTLLAWLVIVVAIFINVVVPGVLPKVEIFVIVFHIAGFIAITAVIWACTPTQNTSHFVFTTALNEGGWSTQGLSYCIGFMGNVATFVGADASVHMAEEVSNAAVNIPRAIICSMFINGAVGFTMMLTILYNLGDVDTVLESATGYPFIQIFYDSVNNVAGATVMGAVVLALTWACATGIITTASRMTWSFARDHGTPFSRSLSYVSKGRRIPTVAVLTVTGLASLLTLIYIGSYVAFNDIVSLTITGFYSSYFLPAAFLLWHRIKGDILPNKQDTPGLAIDADAGVDANNFANNGDGISHLPGKEVSVGDDVKKSAYNDPNPPSYAGHGAPHGRQISVAEAPLVWGPFHLPGWFGIINNAYACVYMIFVVFWSVWPPATPVTYQTMNYSIVVTAGVVLFSIVWYFIRGRKEYNGPVIDDEVAAVVLRRASVVGA
ncbi:amino acid permease-domain-containing protein [Exophiala viscosa]|uniref:Amino acid permease-domain-containing protein n=1 Tax=Exophiala viscosa TaxID=2486360 RepID=A0AAN6E5Z3_9EURO|nr:amino acid permease-domain-containing protein [Exophiala viscosa]KAI1627792.1 amino acid permease-domain-containing protein [Exophiala viscosa]